MATDIYKQQSHTLHQWMQKSLDRPESALKFSILSGHDGKPMMANVAQKIAKHVLSTDTRIDDINIDLVDRFMNGTSVLHM
ncbi:hypothetical protein DFQ30_007144, partial [Apophysomyces sp. BC1015]